MALVLLELAAYDDPSGASKENFKRRCRHRQRDNFS
jgi:hypothetical protein